MYTIGVRAFDASRKPVGDGQRHADDAGCPDRSAPSTPTALVVSSMNETSVSLRWFPSTDDRGVAGYRVFRGPTTVGLRATSYTVAGLPAATATRSPSTPSMPPETARPAPRSSRRRAHAPLRLPRPPADTTAPTTPAGLAATGATARRSRFSGTPPPTTSRVAGYGLYREDVPAGSSSVTNATFSGLTCGRSYALSIDAYDASGNRSAARASSPPPHRVRTRRLRRCRRA